MKFGVIVFPGSNCDHDAYNVVAEVAKQPCSMIWHESEDLEKSDAIIVPGGFAYGDYLRTGAIAAFAPAMKAVRSEEHTSELQSPCNLVCRLLLEKKKNNTDMNSAADLPPGSRARSVTVAAPAHVGPRHSCGRSQLHRVRVLLPRLHGCEQLPRVL